MIYFTIEKYKIDKEDFDSIILNDDHETSCMLTECVIELMHSQETKFSLNHQNIVKIRNFLNDYLERNSDTILNE